MLMLAGLLGALLAGVMADIGMTAGDQRDEDPEAGETAGDGAGAVAVVTHQGEDEDDMLRDDGGSSEGALDWIFGGSGDDVLTGTLDGDGLDSGAGNDLLYGGQGGDVLNGGAGDDRIAGTTAPAMGWAVRIRSTAARATTTSRARAATIGSRAGPGTTA